MNAREKMWKMKTASLQLNEREKKREETVRSKSWIWPSRQLFFLQRKVCEWEREIVTVIEIFLRCRGEDLTINSDIFKVSETKVYFH